MPVVEELTAVLGFKVTGTEELKKFDQLLLGMKKGMEDIATVVHKKLNKAGFQTGSALGRMALAFRAGVSHAALFAGSVARLGAAITLVGTVALSVASAIVKLASAYAKARAEAALLRNEQQLAAKGKGTRVANIDKIGRGFLAMGLRPEEAGAFIGDIAEKARDARLDPEKDKIFGPNKVRVGTKTGKPVDPAAIAVDTIGAWFRLRKQAETAKGATKQVEANRALEQFQKDAGFSDKLVGALAGVTSFAAFLRQTRFFNEANPPEPAADTAREDAIGERWIAVANDFEGVLGGVTRALDRFGMTIQEQVLPIFEAFAGGINGFAKNIGLIDKTVSERDREAETGREFRRGVARLGHTEPPELALARRFGAENPDASGFMAWLFGSPPNQALADLDYARRRYEGVRAVRDSRVGKDAGPSIEQMGGTVASAMADMLEKLRAVQSMMPPRGIPFPQPRPNISNVGNDQRTVTVNVSPQVTVGSLGAAAAAVASAASQAVLGAISTKGSNTSTDAIVAP